MKKKILNYLVPALFFILGTYFYWKSFQAHAAENWMVKHIPQISYTVTKRPGQRTVDELKQEWKKELEFHRKEGERCFHEAKEKCWWLPDVHHRMRARECFQSLIASLGGGSPGNRLMLGLLSLLSSYGLDCIDEWEYIEYKLNWAKFHFELSEHFEMLLDEA